MNGLILDTATDKSILLLVKDFEPLAHLQLKGGPTLSEELIPLLETFLADHQLSIEDIHLLGVGIGPGSYTGLRVGATVAKTLSYAKKIPLIGFCSLMGFSPPQDSSFVTVFDARSAGVYLIKGKKEKGKIEFLSLPYLCPFESAAQLLERSQMILTPDRDLLQIRMGSDFAKISQKTFSLYPDPKQLIALIREKYLAGEYSTKGELSLMYLKND